MKRKSLVLCAFMLCLTCACGKKETTEEYGNLTTVGSVAIASDDSTELEEETNMEADTANRTLIAEALSIDEDSRNIRFILNGLHTINAGQIQSAKASESDGEQLLDVVAEDGTSYRIYLTNGGSLDSVKNLDTGEWPIQSTR